MMNEILLKALLKGCPFCKTECDFQNCPFASKGVCSVVMVNDPKPSCAGVTIIPKSSYEEQ